MINTVQGTLFRLSQEAQEKGRGLAIQKKVCFVLGDPVFWEDYPGFEIDPLGELTTLERGIATFCHDQNQSIELVIGDQSISLELFRDILRSFFQITEGLRKLKVGISFSLDFGELAHSLRFDPTESDVRCVIQGSEHAPEMTYFLSKSSLVGALSDFLLMILRRAKKAGYLSHEEIEGIVKEIQTCADPGAP